MSPLSFLSVPELLALDLTAPNVLIDRFLWEGDTVFLVAPEKSGKSILSMQMALALASGQPFLDRYAIPKPVQVAYIHTEGKTSQTKDWLTRLLDTQPPSVAANMYYRNYPSIALDTKEGMGMLLRDLAERQLQPRTFFIDSLYHAMRGKLTDDNDARRFTEAMRLLIEHFSCSIIINHHTHRAKRTEAGELIEEGDEAIMGSFVWKAHADHTLILKLNKRTKHGTLTCETQRSAEVEMDVKLRLQQPTPLGFIIEDTSARGKVWKALQEAVDGLSVDELVALKIGVRMTVYRALDDLLEAKQVEKVEGKYPIIYRNIRKSVTSIHPENVTREKLS